MEPTQSHIPKSKPATEGAVCRTVFENHPARALACDYADLVHHHNERVKSQLDSEPDYDCEGLIPHN